MPGVRGTKGNGKIGPALSKSCGLAIAWKKKLSRGSARQENGEVMVDVRKSDIESLTDKVKKEGYGKYLPKLRIIKARSFENQDIFFDFPVTAIIGTNGGGKSTVLGSAALAYKASKPGDFFPKSNVGDLSMSNWRIEYDVIDRGVKPDGLISRNARFVSQKWRRDEILDREVVYIPIQRTVPANEQTKFKRFIGMDQVTDIDIFPLSEVTIKSIGRILGKDASNYRKISFSGDPANYLLASSGDINDYSQFHFGAGEASIIDMVSRIEESSDNALMLIEEIENGLHPLATQKMVEYLIDVAKRKKSQVIFTSHSEYALNVLPPHAIWACIDGRAYQGKLSIESLRALTGNVQKDRAIFVEDEFAKDLVTEILRQYAPDVLRKSEVHKAGGFPYVVDVLRHHNANPSITSPAIAIIDGDNPPSEETSEKVIELPEGAPESVVFGYIHENAASVAALVQQRCQCPTVTQDAIVNAISEVYTDTTDHHLYFAKLGTQLGFISELIVRRALCSIYAERCGADLKALVEKVEAQLA